MTVHEATSTLAKEAMSFEPLSQRPIPEKILEASGRGDLHHP
jgi:hypothetical protein